MSSYLNVSPNQKVWTVRPKENGLYAQNYEFKLADGGVDVHLMNDETSPERFIENSGENFYVLAVLKGELVVLGCQNEKEFREQKEGTACAGIIRAGEVVSINGAHNIGLRQDSTFVIISFRDVKKSDARRLTRLTSFRGQIGPNTLLSYSKQGAQAFTAEEISKLSGSSKSVAYTSVMLNMFETPPFSFSTDGPKTGGEKRGRFVIAKDVMPGSPFPVASDTLALAVFYDETRPGEVKHPSLLRWGEQLSTTNQAHVPYYKNESTEITLNSLSANETIPAETHHDVDQIILVIEGRAIVNTKHGDDSHTYEVASGTSLLIPAHTQHEVRQFGPKKLKFISVYAKATK